MGPNLHENLVNAIQSYEMPDAAKELLREQELILICGITSAGKDTLANNLATEGGHEVVISHTTREARQNHGVWEQDGVDYFFVDEETMLDKVTNHEFIEAEKVFDDTYGTSLTEVEKIAQKGLTPILVIDVKGMVELVSNFPNQRPIFVLPPSFEAWQERLEKRGKLSEEKLTKRFNDALKEIDTALNHPNFQLLVNRDVDTAAEEIRAGHIGRDHDAVDVADRLHRSIEDHLSTR